MAKSPKKKGANGAGQPPASGAAPADGAHNGLDEAIFHFHVQAMLKAEAACEEARNIRKTARKAAKLAGIELKRADAIVTMLDWEPGEIRKYFATLNQYALWSGLPVGTQADLFAEIPEAARESVDWEARGFAAAVANKGAFAGDVPKECPPDRAQDWARGVFRGQDRIAWAMAECGKNPERLKIGVGVSHVPLEPEPEAAEGAAAEERDAALAGPTPEEAILEEQPAPAEESTVVEEPAG